MPTALQHINRNMFGQAGVLVPSARDDFESMPARELQGTRSERRVRARQNMSKFTHETFDEWPGGNLRERSS